MVHELLVPHKHSVEERGRHLDVALDDAFVEDQAEDVDPFVHKLEGGREREEEGGGRREREEEGGGGREREGEYFFKHGQTIHGPIQTHWTCTCTCIHHHKV